jgi:hypothetical protein
MCASHKSFKGMGNIRGLAPVPINSTPGWNVDMTEAGALCGHDRSWHALKWDGESFFSR